jgi:hypothetical protein
MDFKKAFFLFGGSVSFLFLSAKLGPQSVSFFLSPQIQLIKDLPSIPDAVLCPIYFSLLVSVERTCMYFNVRMIHWERWYIWNMPRITLTTQFGIFFSPLIKMSMCAIQNQFFIFIVEIFCNTFLN